MAILSNNFTYCALDLKINAADIKIMTKEALSLPKRAWHFNKYRNTNITWLYFDSRRSNYKKNNLEYDWTDEAKKHCPYTMELVQDLIFPFMDPLGRVTILDTLENTPMNVHIDSQKSEIGQLRHKLRVSLIGDIDKLYFLNKDKEKIYVPKDYHTYVLDGTHPHSIDAGTRKMTLCIGSPWNGQSTSLYESLIRKSPSIMNVTRPEIEPTWEDERFDKEDR